MSELLLQSLVENEEKQNLLLQTMSSDADKSSIEQRKFYEELNAKVTLLLSSRIDPNEFKKLSLTVESLKMSVSQAVAVQSKRYLMLTKFNWFVIGMFVLFLSMSWCWGYTFRGWSVAEIGGIKYRYLQSIPNNFLARFCRKADSLYAVNPSLLSDSTLLIFAGEKEKSRRNSTIKPK